MIDPVKYFVPGWTERDTIDIHSQRAQEIHKSIFEEMVLDLVPFTEVNKPGFLRHHQRLAPDFKVFDIFLNVS